MATFFRNLSLTPQTRFRVITLVLSFFSVWIWTAWNDLKSGSGFMRLHLDASQQDLPPDTSIEAYGISVNGSVEHLTPRANDPKKLSLKRFTGNINEIRIFGIPKELESKATLYASWEDETGPKTRLKGFLTKTVVDEDTGRVGISLTRSQPASFLKRFQTSLNWQGDFWFLSLTLFKSLRTLLGIELIFTLSWTIAFRLKIQNSSLRKYELADTQVFVVSILSYIFLAILTIQIYDRLTSGLLNFRDPIQQGALVAIQIAILLGLRASLFYCNTDRRSIATWGMAIAVLFLLKTAWTFCVDTQQCNDYSIYWNYGKAIANGNWDQIDADGPLGLVLLRRSWAWCSWVARLFGGYDLSLKLANLSLQLITTIMLSWYIKKRLGTAAMAGAAIAFVVHPENWLSVTLASHDLPAMFWFVVLTITIDTLAKQLAKPIVSVKEWAKLGCKATLAGSVIAILEIQRDFGIFAIIAGLLMLLGYILPNLALSKEKLNRTFVALTVAIVALGSYTVTRKSLEHEIRSHFPKMQKLSTLAFVTSVESRGQPSWDQMQPWRFLYFPAIPEEEKLKFSISKLTQEKLVRLGDYRRQVWENIKLLGFSGGLVSFAFGGIPGSFAPDGPIPWSSFLFAASAWIESLLGILLIIRVSMSWKIRPYFVEIFPFLFCFIQSVAIILFGEVNPSYDSFLAVPFTMSIAVLFASFSKSKTPPESGVSLKSPICDYSTRRQSNYGRHLCLNAAPFVLATILLAALTKTTPSWNSEFHIPQLVNHRVSPGDYENAVVFDEDGIYLSLANEGLKSSGTKSMQSITVDWSVVCAKDRPLHFFIAGNQRKMKTTKSMTPQSPDKTRLRLTVNDEVIFAGNLGDISKPQWKSIVPTTVPANFRFTFEQEASADSYQTPKGISFEYFWQPQ